MGKLRIYELAKELDVSNKMILAFCQELGIEGKKSHSSTLSDIEADKVRRHLVRSSMSEQTTVKDRVVDGEVLREKRTGNIVRRRRRSVDNTEDGSSLAADDAESAVVEEGDEVVEVAVGEVPVEVVSETEEDETSIDEAVSAISDSGESSEVVTTDEVVVEASGEEPQESETVSVEEVQETAAEPEVELSEEQKTAEPEEAIDLESIRARHDVRAPKILGKISLPTEPVKKKPVKVVEQQPVVVVEEDRGDDGRKKKKKRKKTVLRRDDLLDYDSEMNPWAHRKERRGKKKQSDSRIAVEANPTKASKLVVKVHAEITVGDLAKELGVKSSELIVKLMGLGVTAGINQIIDYDTATIVAEEYGFYNGECWKSGRRLYY